jgi:hypothetical protein
MSKLLGVPASESLLAQFHLVAISLFTLLFDLGVVGVAFASALASLTDAGEDNRAEEKGTSCTATTVDSQLGGLWKSLEFLSERQVRNGSCGDGLSNG